MNTLPISDLRGRLAALLEATKVVASSLNLEQSLQAIVQQATIISGTNVVRLLLLDEEEKILRCRVGVGIPPGAERDIIIPLGESFSGQVAATGKPLAIADCREDPRLRFSEHITKYSLISYLGLPVKLGDRVLGVLVFNTQAPRTYSDEEIAYLSAFADQAAIAIENARLYEVARREIAERTQAKEALARRTQQLEAIRTVTTEITRELDLPTLLELITRRAAELVGGSSGTVWLCDEEVQLLVPMAWHGLGDWAKDQRRQLGEGVSGTVAQRREGLIVNDYPMSPYANAITLKHTKISAILAEPLIYRDRLLGVLTGDKHGPGGSFTAGEQEVLRLFATQAAIAIENARLHSAAIRRGEELEALLRATRSIMSGLDLRGILDRILTEAALISRCPNLQIFLVDRRAGTLRAEAVKGLEAREVGFVISLGTGLSGLVGQTGQPVFIEDLPQDSRNLHAQEDRELGLVTYLGLPIKSRDEVLGVLTFLTTAPRHYTPDEVAYLTSFADQAAIAIENARLYDTIRQYADELEMRVRQRTAELEEALRVKTEFLSKMSHELRTPLNFILGFSDLLGQGVAGPLSLKQAAYVDRIQGGGRRLLRLVTDVLDIAQVDVGKNRLQLEPVVVGPLVQEVLGLVQVQASQKQLHITTSLDPWLPFVVADRFKLGQVLFRLVSNAVKFTPAGGSITVRTYQEAEGRKQAAEGRGQKAEGREQEADGAALLPSADCQLPSAVIEVEDTGIGIRPEDLETIFAAFHQVDGSDTRAYEGAGLGLSLVRRFVEQHGGRVWAESPGLGQGARFVVRLPRLEIPRAKTVLLVEDDAVIRATMTTALENAGFKVIQAADGSQALAVLAGEPPDLLILDLALPDMDGWEILRRVRGVEEIPRFPVLAITGPEGASAEKTLSLGADEFLATPVSPRVLVDTVLRLLSQPAVGRRVEAAEESRDWG